MFSRTPNLTPFSGHKFVGSTLVRALIDSSLDPTLGALLTNAKKVTVSVLYWYEKLSSPRTEIFELILQRIKNFFLWIVEPKPSTRRQTLCPTGVPDVCRVTLLGTSILS